MTSETIRIFELNWSILILNRIPSFFKKPNWNFKKSVLRILNYRQEEEASSHPIEFFGHEANILSLFYVSERYKCAQNTNCYVTSRVCGPAVADANNA